MMLCDLVRGANTIYIYIVLSCALVYHRISFFAFLSRRTHDVSRSGFNQWPFMSVHTWGEAPHGSWQLEIHNEGRFMGKCVFELCRNRAV